MPTGTPVGDATATIDDGILTLTVDLRSPDEAVLAESEWRRREHVDRMTLHCEVAARPDRLAEAIGATLTSITGLHGDVAFAAPGELANDGKVIDDRRAHG